MNRTDPISVTVAEIEEKESVLSALPRKYRFAITVLIVFILIAATSITLVVWEPKKKDLETLFQEKKQSVVYIENGLSTGSGIVIAKDESTSCVVTNFHVIENATSVTVMDYLGNAYEGTLCAMPVNDEDLCLLLIDTTKIPAIRSVKPYDEVKVGSDVFAIGHPVGQTYSLTEGIISAKREERYLQTDTPISSGNSGGPLFLEHTGELAGINTLALHEAQDEESVVQNLNFAERADIVYDRNTWNFTPGTPSSIQEALPNGRMQ